MKHLSFTIRMLVLVTLLLLNSVLSGAGVMAKSVDASPYVEAEQTWVLESPSQFRLDAPPDEAATAEEIAQLVEMAAHRDEAALLQIRYWNAGAPVYRWNQIAMDALVERAAPTMMGLRDLALLHIAIYDATIAAWDNKYTYNRLRPSEMGLGVETVIANPDSPSYPSEHAVTAGAAATILAWLFPEDAQFFQDKAQEAATSRLMAGVEYPSDVEAGLELGRQVAELVIERGKVDGSDAQWTGSVPTEAGHWTGENPTFAMAGTWKPWVLSSPDQFRPAPPLAYDSDELAAEMDELRTFERTPVTDSRAMFWEFAAGGRLLYWFWNDVASRLILEADWNANAPEAARAYALANIAGYDAMIACWDAKYTYWAIRPFQLDPEFKPLFNTPNHPSYPSAHSCMSSAMGGILAHLFPANAEEVTALAQQAGESRIWAGLHFRSDIIAGETLGLNVAEAVLNQGLNDDAQQ